jgi:hypothetical protein
VSTHVQRLIALAVTLMSASVAFACPVCGADKDDAARQAFFDTTIFLSLLPLAMFGGLVYWFVRRARAAELGDAPRIAPQDDGGRAA